MEHGKYGAKKSMTIAEQAVELETKPECCELPANGMAF